MAVTPCWYSVLRACRPFWRVSQSVRRFSAELGNVVIISPHPDDETIGAGGAAALHVRAGAHVTVVVVTDGGGSRAARLAPEEMVIRRAAEIESAMYELGIESLVQLRVPERRTNTATVRATLEPLVANADIVYSPSCVDFHPDHLDVASVVADVVHDDQLVRVYEIGVPLTPTLVNLVADISAIADRKTAAIQRFATQAGNLVPLARLERYRRALYGVEPSEVFWELPAEKFRRLMKTSVWTWDDTPFRGVRRLPISDLGAFVVGRRTRKRLCDASTRADQPPPATSS